VGFVLKTIRFKFRKTEKVKFISHIEMMNAFMRALRRAGLDVIYTQGFNPGMRLVFALPLPVGVTSDSEYADIWFNIDYSCQEAIDKLSVTLPDGFELLEAFEVEKSSLMEDVGSAIYVFKVNSSKNLKNALDLILSLDSIEVDKSNKKGPVDILPYIYKIDYHDEHNFSVLCKAGAKGNLHPRLLLKALEKYSDTDIEEISINRNKLFLKVQ
jgi:radical SAM-linked protein